MVDIFQEVEEDLKRERAEALWRKYGKVIVGVAAVVVLGVAGREGWKTYEHKKSVEDGTRLVSAIELTQAGADKKDAALAALDKVIADGNTDYKALGHFQKASVYLRAGAKDSAVNELNLIASDTGIDKIYRDLATLEIAMNTMSAENAKDLITKVEPIAVPENSWYYSARELLAALHIAAGNIEAAKPLLTDISDDNQAPSGVRQRAAELLKAIGA